MPSNGRRRGAFHPGIAGVDLRGPNVARINDYLLGGDHHFAVDREVADRVTAAVPSTPHVVRSNRSFLRRATYVGLWRGIDQFLDLGSGIPTVGNTHEIVQHVNPEARALYVDHEPVAVAHAHNLLADQTNAAMLYADLREPQAVLHADLTRSFLDLTRPVAVLMVGVLHSVMRAREVVAAYRDELPAGSLLILSHPTADRQNAESVGIHGSMAPVGGTVAYRSWPEVRGLFDGFDLVDPGVVWAPNWCPDRLQPADLEPERCATWCGVGVKS